MASYLMARDVFFVMPAKAGIQLTQYKVLGYPSLPGCGLYDSLGLELSPNVKTFFAHRRLPMGKKKSKLRVLRASVVNNMAGG